MKHDLVIQACPHLRTLGLGTVVGGDLILEGVPALTSFPSDLEVHGRVRWQR